MDKVEARPRSLVGGRAVSTFDEVKRAIADSRYYTTKHANEEAEDDNLDLEKVIERSLGAELLEDYPTAYPHPACLMLGWLCPGEPVHVVWAYDRRRGYAAMVTTYRPDPARWSADFRKRAKP
jgi:hypothetical protein